MAGLRFLAGVGVALVFAAALIVFTLPQRDGTGAPLGLFLANMFSPGLSEGGGSHRISRLGMSFDLADDWAELGWLQRQALENIDLGGKKPAHFKVLFAAAQKPLGRKLNGVLWIIDGGENPGGAMAFLREAEPYLRSGAPKGSGPARISIVQTDRYTGAALGYYRDENLGQRTQKMRVKHTSLDIDGRVVLISTAAKVGSEGEKGITAFFDSLKIR